MPLSLLLLMILSGRNTKNVGYVSLVLLLLTLFRSKARTPLTVSIFNDSESRLYVQWLNPATKKWVDLQDEDDPMMPSAVTNYRFFTSDELIITERGNDCEEECRQTKLVLEESEKEESDATRYYLITAGLKIHLVTDPQEWQALSKESYDEVKKKKDMSSNTEDEAKLYIENIRNPPNWIWTQELEAEFC